MGKKDCGHIEGVGWGGVEELEYFCISLLNIKGHTVWTSKPSKLYSGTIKIEERRSNPEFQQNILPMLREINT